MKPNLINFNSKNKFNEHSELAENNNSEYTQIASSSLTSPIMEENYSFKNLRSTYNNTNDFK